MDIDQPLTTTQGAVFLLVISIILLYLMFGKNDER